MPFLMQTVYDDIGSSNPIVARLGIQPSELLAASRMDEPARREIADLYSGLMTRLVACYRSQKKIADSLASQEADRLANPSDWVRRIPYVTDLDQLAQGFLYEAKNFLRDSLQLFNLMLSTDFHDASDYVDLKGKTGPKLIKALDEILGAGNPLSEHVLSRGGYIDEIVRKRNAVEHPGGFSGALVVNNVRSVLGDWSEPSWQRGDGRETSILTDMEKAIETMLELAEENLVYCLTLGDAMGPLAIYEIPMEHRKLQSPVRFQIGISKDFPLPKNG